MEQSEEEKTRSSFREERKRDEPLNRQKFNCILILLIVLNRPE